LKQGESNLQVEIQFLNLDPETSQDLVPEFHSISMKSSSLEFQNNYLPDPSPDPYLWALDSLLPSGEKNGNFGWRFSGIPPRALYLSLKNPQLYPNGEIAETPSFKAHLNWISETHLEIILDFKNDRLKEEREILIDLSKKS
jgi:hypothetical protein